MVVAPAGRRPQGRDLRPSGLRAVGHAAGPARTRGSPRSCAAAVASVRRRLDWIRSGGDTTGARTTGVGGAPADAAPRDHRRTRTPVRRRRPRRLGRPRARALCHRGRGSGSAPLDRGSVPLPRGRAGPPADSYSRSDDGKRPPGHGDPRRRRRLRQRGRAAGPSIRRRGDPPRRARALRLPDHCLDHRGGDRPDRSLPGQVRGARADRRAGSSRDPRSRSRATPTAILSTGCARRGSAPPADERRR